VGGELPSPGSPHFREFRKGARDKLFYIFFCVLVFAVRYLFFLWQVFKSRKEKGVLRKTLIDTG